MTDMTPEQLERLAILIHKNYTARQALRGLGQKIKYPTWESLPPTLKNSNFRQAATIPDKLNKIGCYLEADDQPGQDVDSFTEEEIERLAEYEHELWVKEREESGWVLAPEKDDAKKETPFMVSYDELTDDIRELDRDTVRNIIPLVHKVGLKVFRLAPGEQVENRASVWDRDRQQRDGQV
ncbi:MAG: hypothetical protein LBK67_09365 [Coriobacteriales bacterium]|jgi:hypothetical protein|nr:hypothetical protein [Coriobacteriales bacterium]